MTDAIVVPVIDVTIKNYRCFSESNPARIRLEPGFVALVGPNNSGKSTLLRFFYEFKPVFSELRLESTIFHLLAVENSASGRELFVNLPVNDHEELFHSEDQRPITVFVESRFPTPEGLDTISTTISVGRGLRSVLCTITHSRPRPPKIQMEDQEAVSDPTPTHFGLMFNALAECMYIGAHRSVLNLTSGTKYYDIEANQRFVQSWTLWKNGTQKRDNRIAVTVTEDVRRLFHFGRLEINASHDNTTLQLVIDGKPHRLEEVGSGIAQVIVAIANAAMSKPMYILIDEPEVNLHPALQVEFLTSLASYSQAGVVFATHSIGLARAVGTKVYLFNKDRASSSCTMRDFDPASSLAELLGELSYSARSEIGAEQILLVEGPTDLTTTQQFLRLLKKDHKVVMVPLGGASMISEKGAQLLAELCRLSSKISVIIDSEKATPETPLSKVRQQFVADCKRLGMRCHVLERRAMENYLTDDAVKQLKGNRFRALEPFELLRTTENAWAKSDNWRIARHMTSEELCATDLGVFLLGL